MASKRTLNAKNLEALGATALAELLIEVSGGNAVIQRRCPLSRQASRINSPAEDCGSLLNLELPSATTGLAGPWGCNGLQHLHRRLGSINRSQDHFHAPGIDVVVHVVGLISPLPSLRSRNASIKAGQLMGPALLMPASRIASTFSGAQSIDNGTCLRRPSPRASEILTRAFPRFPLTVIAERQPSWERLWERSNPTGWHAVA